MNKPTIEAFGETAININWEAKIDPKLHSFITQIDASLNTQFVNEILETVTTYHSLVIYLRQGVSLPQMITRCSQLLLNSTLNKKEEKTVWQIPVCYESPFAWDIEEVATHNNLTVSEVIEKHTKRLYRIYFTGFLPGFLYLGGLDTTLHTPRKSTPRASISRGAVAIGGSQTGIYPQDSPGGWQIIGKTPIPLFDLKKKPPTPFNPGEHIQFISINKNEFEAVLAQVNNGTYTPLKIRKND